MEPRADMESKWLLLLLMTVGITSASLHGDGYSNMKEYCEQEIFNPTCGPDHVIWIRSALYGRMSMGRCVRVDYGSLGCSEDVRHFVQSQCGGRRECEFAVSVLHETGRCPNELRSYLSASYDCIPVSSCSNSLCKTGSYLRVPMSQNSGFIGGITTSETGCGSPSCPWMLEPQEGQRVNMTFYVFDDPDKQNNCHRQASVVDKKTKVSKDITAGCNGSPMVTSVVTSESAPAEVKVYVDDLTSRIIIHYKVIGCPSITPPDGSTMTRHENTLTVKCKTTSRSWHLTCNENAWVGEIGVCEDPGKSAAWITEGHTTSAQGLALVVGIGVALGVLLGFTLLGLAVFCMRRHRRNHYQRPNEIVRYPPESDKSYDVKLYEESSPNKAPPNTDTGYYTGTTYQLRQPAAVVTRPVTSQRPTPAGVPAVPTYFQSIGSAEAPYKFRDHVYESPHFKQEDAHSVNTAAST